MADEFLNQKLYETMTSISKYSEEIRYEDLKNSLVGADMTHSELESSIADLEAQERIIPINERVWTMKKLKEEEKCK